MSDLTPELVAEAIGLADSVPNNFEDEKSFHTLAALCRLQHEELRVARVRLRGLSDTLDTTRIDETLALMEGVDP